MVGCKSDAFPSEIVSKRYREPIMIGIGANFPKIRPNRFPKTHGPQLGDRGRTFLFPLNARRVQGVRVSVHHVVHIFDITTNQPVILRYSSRSFIV
jgi:hypothetical protein